MCGIPGSLSGLTSLTHLDLSEWAEDPLALHLTAGAPLLPKLKTLVLDHCRSLTSASLDRALSHGAEVSSASTPSLADNAGSTTRKGVPSSLGCLEDLSMAWSGLGRGGERESAGQLPASVSRLTQLTRLRLSGCADLRGTLCEGIGALRRLRELHLDGTQIDALPRNARCGHRTSQLSHTLRSPLPGIRDTLAVAAELRSVASQPGHQLPCCSSGLHASFS